MVIVGVDPGLSGAAAALRTDDPVRIVEAIDLPTRVVGLRRRLDVSQLASWISEMKPSRIIIEAVGPMPSDGRVAAFRFGEAVGTIHTICRMISVEPELVSPLVWKGYYLLVQADKEASRRKALKLFPAARFMLDRKKDHNRAEAMLIARWGARPLIGRDW